MTIHSNPAEFSTGFYRSANTNFVPVIGLVAELPHCRCHHLASIPTGGTRTCVSHIGAALKSTMVAWVLLALSLIKKRLPSSFIWLEDVIKDSCARMI
jgi:hypothetical protein